MVFLFQNLKKNIRVPSGYSLEVLVCLFEHQSLEKYCVLHHFWVMHMEK